MSLQTVKTEELVQLLETGQAAVFGTGFVAEMFYLALERNGLWDRIRFCVTTSAPEGETFHGRPVVSLGTARFSDAASVQIFFSEAMAFSFRITS